MVINAVHGAGEWCGMVAVPFLQLMKSLVNHFVTEFQNVGAPNVYNKGLIAELIGITQIENHAYKFSLSECDRRDKNRSNAIGTQQHTSEKHKNMN
jgi:hypothetical protein